MTSSLFPAQIDDIDDDRHAVAPYNFVPLPQQVVPAETPLPAHNQYHQGRHTGRIECTLTTSSPLYVRCALTRQEFAQAEHERQNPPRPARNGMKHKSDFFYTIDPESPVIPGSSLRGMLRSLVEIASFGKIAWVTDNKLVYRAIGDRSALADLYRDQIMDTDSHRKHYYTPKVEAGYLRCDRGLWFIQPAQYINGVSFARINQRRIPLTLRKWGTSANAWEIWVQVTDYAFHPIRGGFLSVKRAIVTEAHDKEYADFHRAVLVKSGPMQSKRSEAVIFEADTAAEPIPLQNELIAAYREQLTQEQQHLLGPDGVLIDHQPVFFIRDAGGKLLFFGHTMMMRLPYTHTPHEAVPTDLRNETIIDLADAIFGYVRREVDDHYEEPARAGRVFVQDAKLVDGQSNIFASRQPIVPRILGSPKPTTFQHYLVQTTDQLNQLNHYSSPNPVIRGHKLYWHQGDVSLETIKDTDYLESIRGAVPDADTQHTHLHPVRSGVQFTFNIDFENLSDVELGALLWVLQIADKEQYRLKVGMGKPLGMGSVAISSSVTRSNRVQRYQTLFDDSAWHTAETAMSEEQMQTCIAAFTNHILTSPGNAGTVFESLPRIKELLTLLTWHESPLPDQQHTNPKATATRYMEIERPQNLPRLDGKERRGVVNEYAFRPVLPLPSQVVQSQPSATPPPPSTPKGGADYDGEVVEWDAAQRKWIVETREGYRIVAEVVQRALRDQVNLRRRVKVRTHRNNPETGEIRRVL